MLLIQRRDFLGLVAAAGLARTAGRVVGSPAPARALRIVLADSTRDVERGATMAVEEAQRAAAMFGGSIAIGDGPGLRVVIGGEPADPPHDVHMNVVDLRAAARAGCFRKVFHIAPRQPGLTWQSGLTRFGADTLNKRYHARYDAAMTPTAWNAWFAVKCAWEAALKSRASDAEALTTFLQSAGARFDGHKGVALYFNKANQLMQPLYDPSGKETFQFSIERKCVDWK